MKFKILTSIIIAAALSACDSGPDSDAPDIVINLPPASSSSSSSGGGSSGSGEIVNTDLPVYEDFEAENVGEFFSGSYLMLQTDVEEDPDAPFYYPTAGYYNDDGTLDLNPDFWITPDTDKALRIGSRFTIGQTWSTSAGADIENPKKNTTPGTAGESWGELDLSQDYKLSFCVVDAGGVGSKNFQIYVDNNTTGQANSIHLGDSRLLSVSNDSLVPGQRVEIYVPGNATLEPGGLPVDTYGSVIGTENSFFQLRTESESWVVIDDLKIEYQNAIDDSALPDCSLKSTAWGEVDPSMPATPENPVMVAAGDGQIEVSWDGIQYSETYTVAYNTVESTTDATLITDLVEPSTLLTGLTNGTQYYIYVQGVNVNGAGEFSPVASATPSAATEAPGVPAGLTLTAGDGEIDVMWTEVTGASTYTVAYNTADDIAGATEVAAVTETSTTISGLVNEVVYYVFVKASNSAGDSAYSASMNATPTQDISVTPLPLMVDLSVDKATFFGDAGTDFKAISSDPTLPFYNVTGGGSNITIADGKLSMNNARFTIGDFTGADTADAVAPLGDLDLSVPYRITIVLSDFTDNADTTDAAGQFVVYVDNNTSSSGSSLHGSSSKVYTLNADDASLTSFPYTITIEPTVGTAHSFIQVRTDSRVGNATIDSITVEYIGDPPASNQVITEDFSAADSATFFSADYASLATDDTLPMYVATGGASNIVVADGEIAMANARFTIGDTGVATADGVTPSGTLDLSQPYTIKFTIKEFTNDDSDLTDANGKIQVYVDNNDSSSASSIHGASSKLWEVAVDDGTITSLPYTVTIDSTLGTTTSFIQLRADSRVGTYVIDDFSIEYQ